MNSKFTRRTILKSIPALITVPSLMAQTGAPAAASPIRLRKLHHFGLNVADVPRSVDFYQGLFGMPVQARQGSTVHLRIGPGPQFMSISPAGSNPPSIATRVGFTVDNFNADRLLKLLTDRKIPARITKDGNSPELFFDDPDGIVVHLVDPSYCGGSGPLGSVCKVEASPKKGLLALKELSHFTIAVSNADRSNTFYQELLGLKAQAHQAASPVMGVGDRIQFLMFTGGAGARGGAPARPANINHVCMNMDGFNVENIFKTLEGYGIKKRDAAPTGGAAAGPLISYVSLRMPNRGGAEGGTPEFYFTDPDGLLLQLQDVKYCGGGGFLGDVCTE
jgi:catechol 2,3-dioxygenase-like lactoylglutathione lyase family enzyme